MASKQEESLLEIKTLPIPFPDFSTTITPIPLGLPKVPVSSSELIVAHTPGQQIVALSSTIDCSRLSGKRSLPSLTKSGKGAYKRPELLAFAKKANFSVPPGIKKPALAALLRPIYGCPPEE